MSGGRGGRRGQNSSVSDTSQDEINALIREQIHGDFLEEIKTLLRKEVRSSIQDEIKDSIRAKMQAVIKAEVSGRLERLETSLQQLAELSQDVVAVKWSIDFTSKNLDDLHQTVLPALASHIEQVATSLALQTLDLDMHRRKWSITIHGLKGKAKEEEADAPGMCEPGDITSPHSRCQHEWFRRLPSFGPEGQCRGHYPFPRPCPTQPLAQQREKPQTTQRPYQH